MSEQDRKPNRARRAGFYGVLLIVVYLIPEFILKGKILPMTYEHYKGAFTALFMVALLVTLKFLLTDRR
jgi:hypothetical protein